MDTCRGPGDVWISFLFGEATKWLFSETPSRSTENLFFMQLVRMIPEQMWKLLVVKDPL